MRRAEADPQALLELERFRRSLVVMFSDIQGSTAYFEQHGDTAGLFMVHQCNSTILSEVEKHGGKVVKTIGDGTMATFPEPKEAVQAAIAIQKTMSIRAEADRISVRIGMHYGSGIVRTNDVFGDVVNTASRVESVASPGQILVSEELYGQVRECGFSIHEQGRFALKGKAGERTLFEVTWQPGEIVSVSSPAKSSATYKLQVVLPDASAGAEYSVESEVGVGVAADGNLLVSSDIHSAGMRARLFVENQLLFVENLRTAGNAVFIRLTCASLLENGDTVLAGHQLFQYEEKPEATLTTETTTAQGKVAITPAKAAALVRVDSSGNPLERYPLETAQVQFGRTTGSYVFPKDNLMSRSHFTVSQRGEDFVIEDAGSRNGTFLQVRKKTPVSAGTVLLIAGQYLKVVT